MIVADIDPGGGHPFPRPRIGQVVGNALVVGSRTVVWPDGRIVEEQDVVFWARAWQAIGGQAAGGYLALRYLLRQLEQLAGNTEAQPVLIRWAATGEAGQYNVATPHDGWYVVSNVQPNYDTILSGLVEVRMQVARAASYPSPLGVRVDGAPMGSTYSGTASTLLAFPIGSTGQPSFALARAGAEGSIPTSILPAGGVNPGPFVPGTPAELHKGGVRVYDTVSAGGNAVPTDGTAAHTSWVEVRGTNHDFEGDCIVSNGLLLLRFQLGQAPLPKVYVWNTVLGTPAWELRGDVKYQDNAANVGTLRSLALGRVSPQLSSVIVYANTSGGKWARIDWGLAAGDKYALFEPSPLSEANTNSLFIGFTSATAVKIGFTEGGVADILDSTLPSTSTYGYGGYFGATTNSSLFGFGYQNAPNGSQANPGDGTTVKLGVTNGPAQGASARFALWVMPFPTIANLQGEGESGTLGTGWSSVADAGASGGNTAQCASGTLSGNADLFGASWTPPVSIQFDGWFRVKVASAAGSALEMMLGVWDVTAGAFQNSTTFRANQAATSYIWLKAAGLFQAIAGHTYRFRAVTALTLGTTWSIDQAFLAAVKSATLGQGDAPADLWSQSMFGRDSRIVRIAA